MKVTPMRYPTTFATPAFGPQWKPIPVTTRVAMAAPVAPALPRPRIGGPVVRLGQAAQIARGADLVFGILVGVGAMVAGIAVATTVGRGMPPRPTWQWVGGITAVLGGLKIFTDISKASTPPAA